MKGASDLPPSRVYYNILIRSCGFTDECTVTLQLGDVTHTWSSGARYNTPELAQTMEFWLAWKGGLMEAIQLCPIPVQYPLEDALTGEVEGEVVAALPVTEDGEDQGQDEGVLDEEAVNEAVEEEPAQEEVAEEPSFDSLDGVPLAQEE